MNGSVYSSKEHDIIIEADTASELRSSARNRLIFSSVPSSSSFFFRLYLLTSAGFPLVSLLRPPRLSEP